MSSQIASLRLMAITLLSAVSLQTEVFGLDTLTRVGQAFDYWSTAGDVVFSGDHAFVATGETGLRVLDISDWNNPVQVAVMDGPENWDAMVGAGTMLYAIWINQGLVAIDVSTPENPRVSAQFEFQHLAHIFDISMKPDDPSMLFCASDQGLVLFDVSNQDTLIYISDYRWGSECDNISLSEDNAIITGQYNLSLFDISDSENPVRLSFYAPELEIEFESSALMDTLVYTICRNGELRVTNFADIDNPVEIGVIEPVEHIERIVFRDNLGFVIARTGWRYALYNLFIYDFSNPLEPELIGQGDSTYYGTHITLNGDFAALNNTNEGFRLVDISEPAIPENLGDYGSTGGIEKILIDGDLVIAIGMDGNFGDRSIWTIDIQNPESPEIIGVYSDSLLSQEQNIISELRDDYLFVAIDSVGLMIYDLIDPTNPIRIASVAINDNFMGCYWSEQFYYMATSRSLIYAVDISTPEDAEMIGSIIIPRNPDQRHNTSITLAGIHVVARTQDHIEIWDIRNWNAPQILSSFDLLDIHDMFVDGNRLFVWHSIDNGHVAKISLYDFHRPDRPIRRSAVSNIISPFKRAIEGDYLYISDNYNLEIIDISDTWAIRRVTRQLLDNGIRSIAAEGSTICIAEDNAIGMYDFSEPNFIPIPSDPPLTPGTLSLSAFPSPFNSSTTISFSVGAQGLASIRLAIYDLQGRLAAELVNGRLEAGEHKVVWEAKGLGSGVYVVRLETGEINQIQKLVLLR